METITLKTAPEVSAIIRAADPSYRKQKAALYARESLALSGTYWDGGSRNTYTAVDLSTLRAVAAPQFDPPQFGGGDTRTVAIPEGIAIVRTGVFCGKTAYAAVYLNPANMARLLK
jgi:hypothetical protein